MRQRPARFAQATWRSRCARRARRFRQSLEGFAAASKAKPSTGRWEVCSGRPSFCGHYNDGVLALRYVYILALATWLGGMVVLGAVVAPATFQVLQASAPAGGRLLGGAVFGAI